MFKQIYYLIIVLLFILIASPIHAQYSGTGSNKKTTKVKPYVKKDGTYIKGYRRTKTNSYNLDNFKAKGNYNPYTGKTGTKKYKSPYNSLYKAPKIKSNYKNPYSTKTYQQKVYKIKTYKPKSYKKSYKYK